MPRFQSVAAAASASSEYAVSSRSPDDDEGEGEDDAASPPSRRSGRNISINSKSGPTSTPILPGPSYAATSYVKVYATCRLRRVWFSESRLADTAVPWEFQLYGASAPESESSAR